MADNTFKLRIISPERVFYEGEAIMLECRTTEGEIGILKNHIPLTAVLAPGVARIKESDTVVKAALISGFIEILQDQVTVLAEIAEWPDEIDVKRAEEARIRAERRLQEKGAGTNMARASLALQRSIARIEAAKK
ncbi:MAG: ATP synthase F1 subunit epsilon [Lachnospiraceae bacterium]|nr:ATP synthase F1 subunit epsilon [Lachnospiraceae bacterium]